MNRSANGDEPEGNEYHTSEPKSSSATKALDGLDAKLKVLKLKYPAGNPNLKNAVKLYLHISGNTPKAEWVISNKLNPYQFVKNGVDDEDDEDGSNAGGEPYWVLRVGSKTRVGVSTDLQLKMFSDQRRVGNWNDVWALNSWWMKHQFLLHLKRTRMFMEV